MLFQTRGEMYCVSCPINAVQSLTAMLAGIRNVMNCTSGVQDKELRDIRDRVQDKEGELDTLRKAGKNLRERLDEKEVETRGIMDRVSPLKRIVVYRGLLSVVSHSRPHDLPTYLHIPAISPHACK